MEPTTHELAIVGGGPAGMAAALVAGRARLEAVVLNEELPRNRVTRASYGFLTRDGTHPLEMLRLAKEQLRRYPSVRYVTDKVTGAVREGDAFVLRLSAGGEVRARRVVLASGFRDDLDRLRLPGIHEVYGTSVFPCPFCDGYEHSGARIAAFGAEGIEVYAAMLRMWSDDVHVFTNGRALGAAAKEALTQNGVPFHEAKVLELVAEDGRLRAVRLEGGLVERDVGFLRDKAGVLATSLGDDLGVRRKPNPGGFDTYDADEHGKTGVPGVYVVGDLRTGFSRLMPAAAEGGRCVEQIVHEISQERWRTA